MTLITDSRTGRMKTNQKVSTGLQFLHNIPMAEIGYPGILVTEVLRSKTSKTEVFGHYDKKIGSDYNGLFFHEIALKTPAFPPIDF